MNVCTYSAVRLNYTTLQTHKYRKDKCNDDCYFSPGVCYLRKRWEKLHVIRSSFISNVLSETRTTGFDRVLGFFSSRPNWDHPPLHLTRPPPLWFRGGGTHSFAGERVDGVPIRTMGQTLWYYKFTSVCSYNTCAKNLSTL